MATADRPLDRSSMRSSSVGRAIASGAVGAAVLTVIHQSARRMVGDAPRMDVMGMRALARLGPPTWREEPELLYRLAIVGDLISNSAYYSGVAASTRSETWWRGVVLGAAAGIGALMIPQHIGLGEPPHSDSRRNQLMTIAWYLAGGLAAAAVANALSTNRPAFAR